MPLSTFRRPLTQVRGIFIRCRRPEQENSFIEHLKWGEGSIHFNVSRGSWQQQALIKEWITVATLGRIQESRNKKAAINISRTRAKKFKAKLEYTEPNKQVKRSLRVYKRNYVKDLSMTAEKASRE
ncbi:unnamed protein product [Schistosoma margrebowiei]|uniref:Uncharacterized protein n=1 Tax=Schistosoma margrebowiei TaxID=48269 RepID=A0A183MZN4_9TREM|nr:unnamed protein product [Schistosoma margrebowiei]